LRQLAELRQKLQRAAGVEREHEQALRVAAEASDDASTLRAAVLERDQAAAGHDAREAALVQAKHALKKRTAALEEKLGEANRLGRELWAQVGYIG
jgi:predicted  nucleic acid-binding Zn-ribbon protein